MHPVPGWRSKLGNRLRVERFENSVGGHANKNGGLTLGCQGGCKSCARDVAAPPLGRTGRLRHAAHQGQTAPGVGHDKCGSVATVPTGRPRRHAGQTRLPIARPKMGAQAWAVGGWLLSSFMVRRRGIRKWRLPMWRPSTRREENQSEFPRNLLILGAGYPTRTDDLPLTRRLLYQLS